MLYAFSSRARPGSCAGGAGRTPASCGLAPILSPPGREDLGQRFRGGTGAEAISCSFASRKHFLTSASK